MSARVTDRMVAVKQREVARLLSAAMPGREVEVTLHRGNRVNGVTNKLVVAGATSSTYTTQAWRDGIGGHTNADAYRALSLMVSTLSLIEEV